MILVGLALGFMGDVWPLSFRGDLGTWGPRSLTVTLVNVSVFVIF